MDYIQHVLDQTKNDYNINGLKHNFRAIIKRIKLYLNDQYVEAPSDDAIFWNLWIPRRVHFAKNYDIDTKDLNPEGVGETNIVQAWILKVMFQKWCRDNDFAITIDDMELTVGDFGSAIWKITDDPDVPSKKNIELVQLDKIHFNPLCKTIRKEDVVEIHELTEAQIREKQDIWNNIDELLRRCKKTDDGKYIIYEYWGNIKNGNKFDYVHRITSGGTEDAVIAWEDTDVERKDSPYYDFHLGEWQGTWLRIGGVQRLFKLQERVNRLVNENADVSAIASLLLLKTQQPELHGENALRGAVSGLIINDQSLEQVVINNPAIANFLAELQKIEVQADRLCMTPNVMTGEDTPSSIPFRSTVVFTNAAKSAFKMIRTRVAGGVSKIVLDIILPEQARIWNKKEQIVEIAEDEEDIKFYNKSLAGLIKTQMRIQSILNGTYQEPDEGMVDEVLEEAIATSGRKFKIPKGYFNFDYGIRINPVGEAYDKKQQNDTMYEVNALTLQNPTWYNTPLAKQYLENNGLKWWKLTPKQQQDLIQTPQGQAPQPKQKQDKLLSSVDSI
jgi:hypothetical protein